MGRALPVLPKAMVGMEFPKFSGQSRLSGLTQSGGVNRGRERQRGKEKIYRRV